ncbi:uncharacterized protein GIQ15_00299 [Arthroderma uncinatum]|uniref:uncharacterized protein n=1 Tax=Arthroderma uncinatum TaxID=74035 RepID=UPI00144A5973|nr:uncharacterized protein GIQ15_00299 [Arthroderma uncinatum]KAF3490782.1 hypothetical protein GIQ15_00299 [Arthroderma uncinatum]
MASNASQGALAPLARIAQLEERNVHLNKEIADLQTVLLREMSRQGVAIPLTPIECDEPSGTLQDLKLRHELTHGGDIVDDIEAIRYAEARGLEAVSEFKDNFAKAYNISFDAAVEAVRSSPIELLTTFNALASVRVYPRWQEDDARTYRAAIEHMATHIIEAAMLVEEKYRAGLFGRDGILGKQYDCMQQLYLQRILGIRE